MKGLGQGLASAASLALVGLAIWVHTPWDQFLAVVILVGIVNLFIWG